MKATRIAFLFLLFFGTNGCIILPHHPHHGHPPKKIKIEIKDHHDKGKHKGEEKKDGGKHKDEGKGKEGGKKKGHH